MIPTGKLGQMKPAAPSPVTTLGDLLKSNLSFVTLDRCVSCRQRRFSRK